VRSTDLTVVDLFPRRLPQRRRQRRWWFLPPEGVSYQGGSPFPFGFSGAHLKDAQGCEQEVREEMTHVEQVLAKGVMQKERWPTVERPASLREESQAHFI
jgi:hypothetical protein